MVKYEKLDDENTPLMSCMKQVVNANYFYCNSKIGWP